MKPQPLRPVHQRIFITGFSLALVAILIGSYLAFNGSASFANVSDKLLDSLDSLTSTNLIIKADKVKLAANGQSQTTIVASHPNPPTPITARIVNGSGAITKLSEQATSAKFTYTSGLSVDPVRIEFTTGNIIESIDLELLAATPPPAPQLLSPPNNSSGSQLRPEIIGTGPVDTRIAISVNGQINTTSRTDKQGSFHIRLEKALGNGQQNITAVAINELDIVSNVSNTLVLQIQSQPMTYDAQHIRITPDRIIANESFAVFIPASLNTEKVLVELEGTTYQLIDSNGSSIFSRTLPSPANAGSYTANLILVDPANNQSRFDNVLRFTVHTEN